MKKWESEKHQKLGVFQQKGDEGHVATDGSHGHCRKVESMWLVSGWVARDAEFEDQRTIKRAELPLSPQKSDWTHERGMSTTRE